MFFDAILHLSNIHTQLIETVLLPRQKGEGDVTLQSLYLILW